MFACVLCVRGSSPVLFIYTLTTCRVGYKYCAAPCISSLWSCGAQVRAVRRRRLAPCFARKRCSRRTSAEEVSPFTRLGSSGCPSALVCEGMRATSGSCIPHELYFLRGTLAHVARIPGAHAAHRLFVHCKAAAIVQTKWWQQTMPSLVRAGVPLVCFELSAIARHKQSKSGAEQAMMKLYLHGMMH